MIEKRDREQLRPGRGVGEEMERTTLQGTFCRGRWRDRSRGVVTPNWHGARRRQGGASLTEGSWNANPQGAYRAGNRQTPDS